MLLILLFGFSSGLPLALTGATLQAWMTESGISLAAISIFALVGIPYTLKFVWAPIMDRYVPPFLGRRRGWMVVTQLGLMGAIAALGSVNPGTDPVVLGMLALSISFLSASQDIVIDAYRAEIIEKEELGAAAGVAILGYRLGMLTSGALAMILADHIAWREVYYIMSVVMLVGLGATLAADEPENAHPPRSLRQAMVDPFKQFFLRTGAWEILSFILLYKLGEVMAVALTTPFMLHLQFTKTEIGAVTKAFGLAATISGSLVGGAMMLKIGMKRALIGFGVLQAVSPLCFAALAFVGKNHFAMVLAVATENFFVGLSTAPFIAFLMALCDKRSTATQYALLTSLAALTRVWAQTPTGSMAEHLGWVNFFLFCAAASIPGLLLLVWRFDHWSGVAGSKEGGQLGHPTRG